MPHAPQLDAYSVDPQSTLARPPSSEAPRVFRWVALVGFYVFAGLTGALVGADLPDARRLASIGMGSAATMWWVDDAMRRRVEVPFASLWIGFAYPVVVTGYYFSTRGLAGLPRFVAHVIAVATLFIGAAWWSLPTF